MVEVKNCRGMKKFKFEYVNICVLDDSFWGL